MAEQKVIIEPVANGGVRIRVPFTERASRYRKRVIVLNGMVLSFVSILGLVVTVAARHDVAGLILAAVCTVTTTTCSVHAFFNPEVLAPFGIGEWVLTWNGSLHITQSNERERVFNQRDVRKLSIERCPFSRCYRFHFRGWRTKTSRASRQRRVPIRAYFAVFDDGVSAKLALETLQAAMGKPVHPSPQ